MHTRLAALILPLWRCSLLAPSRDAGVAPTSTPPPPAEHVAPREYLTPPRAAPGREPIHIADGDVVHALDLGRAGFLHCFHRAQHDDPSLGATKINLRLDVDPSGAVVSATTDITDAKFATCLVNTAKRLKFPAPDEQAIATLTFFAS